MNGARDAASSVVEGETNVRLKALTSKRIINRGRFGYYSFVIFAFSYDERGAGVNDNDDGCVRVKTPKKAGRDFERGRHDD